MSTTTAAEQPQTQQAPPTQERQLLDRQTGIRPFAEFEQHLKDRAEAPAKQVPQADDVVKTLTPEQRKEWNDAKAPEKGDAKPPTPETDGKETAGDGKEPKAESQPEPQNNYDRLLERASHEPDFDQVVERLHEPFFPLSQEGYARYETMNYAINQVSNPADVIYFLARPENASIARNMQDAPPHKIAQVVHQISADLRFGGRSEKRAQPVPRAPKPPAEVGGRGISPDDPEESALERGDFRAVKNAWNRRALRGK